MASFNKVILMGNFTRDPELRQTQSGTNICSFSIAINRSYYSSQDGSAREETCFVDVVSFGKSAVSVSKYFSKGKPILVEGRLRQDNWEDKSGQKRTKLTVVLESFEFVDSRGGDSSSGSYNAEYQSSRGAQQQQKNSQSRQADESEDDDVPF